MKNANTGRLGFTLIELLVVVLIIGILAAVALPQYQKAVEKSKSAQALTMLRSVYQAAQAYQLANGVWPTELAQLDINIPWTGHTAWTSVPAHVSNDDWDVMLYDNTTHSLVGVCLGRLRGNWAGGGFCMFSQSTEPGVKPHILYCAERRGNGIVLEEKGQYCEKIFKGTKINEDNMWLYSLP